jgi:hypothetical protein
MNTYIVHLLRFKEIAKAEHSDENLQKLNYKFPL